MKDGKIFTDYFVDIMFHDVEMLKFRICVDPHRRLQEYLLTARLEKSQVISPASRHGQNYNRHKAAFKFAELLQPECW